MLIFAQVLQTIANGEGNRGLGYIYGGRVIAGFGIGAISAVAPAYVSECSPKQVRGRITGMFQIMVAIGVMISYFINCMFNSCLILHTGPDLFVTVGIGLHVQNSSKIWRIPFAFQLVPAGIMALGLLTVRESPRWLVSKGRNTEARGNFVRFLIAFFIFFLQQWCGQNSINYYAPQIFTSVSSSIPHLSSIPNIVEIGYTGATNSLLAAGIYG